MGIGLKNIAIPKKAEARALFLKALLRREAHLESIMKYVLLKVVVVVDHIIHKRTRKVLHF